MYAANSYAIRQATPEDAEALRRLATLDSQAPLAGPILIGSIAGSPVAALSLADGRAVADPFVPTAHVVNNLRVRADALRAVADRPSLRDRLVAGIAHSYRAATASRRP